MTRRSSESFAWHELPPLYVVDVARQHGEQARARRARRLRSLAIAVAWIAGLLAIAYLVAQL